MVNELQTNEGDEYYGPAGFPSDKDPVEILTSSLPPYYRKDPDSNNYRLMEGAAKVIGNMDEDIEAVDDANNVYSGKTISSLQRQALEVDVHYREGEDIEHFRKRIEMNFKLLNTIGTINDLIGATASLLEIQKSTIDYSEEYTTESGCCLLEIPSNAIKEFVFNAQELANILDAGIPVGYRIDMLIPGGYTHTSVEKYQSGKSDPDKAHGGLDSNGEIQEGVGGEYSGLIFADESGGTI